MDKKPVGAIEEMNAFIEKHGLKKILIVIGGVFIGISLLVVTVKVNKVVYDCSENAEAAIAGVMQCEQQKIDADIREQELKLERYKEDKRTELQRIKDLLSSPEVKAGGLPVLMKIVEEKSLQSLKLRKIDDSCVEKVQAVSCRVVK